MKITLGEIAARMGGEVIGDRNVEITGLSSADLAGSGDLTFAENSKYLATAESSLAAAVLVPETNNATGKPVVRVKDVRVAVARLLPLFFPEEQQEFGSHPTAVIHESAQVDPTAHIGPNCVIGPGAKIGARVVLWGGNHIRALCQLGEEVCLHPNVVLYPRTVLGKRVVIHAGTVIGSDGYGYVFDEGRHRKVLQVGNVVIGDDVEIGANAAIDRGAFGSTTVGAGTKIDNLVHVAHNVTIGKHCLILGQAGFAGSTQLGDYAVIASQSGIAGHLKIGRQSTVAAKSGVMRDVADGEIVLGIPAQPHQQTKRQWIAMQRLPDLLRQVREFEKEVTALKTQMRSEAPSKASAQEQSSNLVNASESKSE